MKLTPLDIHHKEFRHSLRGYSEEEVDGFLDQVADEFERLFKENIDMSERLEAATEKVKTYQEMERTLHNTMLAAQRSAEDIVGKAREEADAILKDAEVKAKEIIHNALTSKQSVAGELVRIKQAEEEFRSRFTAMLEAHLKGVTEIALPEDISVLAGVTEAGVISAVEVVSDSATPAFEGRSAVTPEPSPSAVPEMGRRERPGATMAMPAAAAAAVAAEAATPGFVSGVMLGETKSPDLPPDLELAEPREYPMVSFDSLGEREDDLDIEEID